jgi:sortase A
MTRPRTATPPAGVTRLPTARTSTPPSPGAGAAPSTSSAPAALDDRPTAPVVRVSLVKDPVDPIPLLSEEHRFDLDAGGGTGGPGGPGEPPRGGGGPPPPLPLPTPARPTMRLVSQILTIVAVVVLGFLAHVTLLGSIEHYRDQAQSYRELRNELANGLAPVGPLDDNVDHPAALPPGTPVAILDIPQIDVHEVVLESATSSVMRSGAAHRRDSPLPGQVGTSLILGRRAAFGGPFRDLDQLKVGDEFVITTGQGQHKFTVIGLRHAGDPLPPPLSGRKGRVTLVTTDGPLYRPSDVLRVDADVTSDVQEKGPQVPTGSVSEAEKFYAGDPSALLPLLLWGALLLVASVGLVFVRYRVGRKQAWVIGIPVLLMLGLFVFNDVAALLPNLL